MFDIIEIDRPAVSADRKNYDYSGVPFGKLVKPNTGFHFPNQGENKATLSGVANAIRRFAINLTDSDKETLSQEAKNLINCYSVFKDNDGKVWVMLTDYRPGFPASVVETMIAQEQAEIAEKAKLVKRAEKAGTLEAKKEMLGKLEAEIAKLEEND